MPPRAGACCEHRCRRAGRRCRGAATPPPLPLCDRLFPHPPRAVSRLHRSAAPLTDVGRGALARALHPGTVGGRAEGRTGPSLAPRAFNGTISTRSCWRAWPGTRTRRCARGTLAIDPNTARRG